MTAAETSGPPQLVTIVIVGYRAYDELASCLSSLARHEPDVPVVLLDHAADQTRGQALTARFPQVIYLPTSRNDGFAGGVNAAVRHAGPGALLLLNPDCELTAPVVTSLLQVLAEFPRVGVVGGLLRESDGGLQASARHFPNATTAVAGRTSWLSRQLPGNMLSRRNLVPSSGVPTPVDWVSGAFMLVRREAFDQVSGFDPAFFLYWEDADFCKRTSQGGWSTVYVPTPAVIHRTARSSCHAPARSLWAFHRSALRYYLKHGSWLARGASPFVALGLFGRFLIKLPRRLAAEPTAQRLHAPAGRG